MQQRRIAALRALIGQCLGDVANAFGLLQDGWNQILEGLQPGDTVVTDGAVFLSNKLSLGDAG